MRKLFQSLLVALVVLGLPLRGYAAATMQLCEAAHHLGLGIESRAIETHQHDSGAVDPGHADGHQDADAGSHDSHLPSTCSACGACCSGASASSSVPAFPAIKPVSAIVVVPAQRFSGVVLENPERPPLSLVL